MGMAVVDKSVAVVDTHKALGIVEDLVEQQVQVQGLMQVRQQKPIKQLRPHLQHEAAVTPWNEHWQEAYRGLQSVARQPVVKLNNGKQSLES